MQCHFIGECIWPLIFISFCILFFSSKNIGEKMVPFEVLDWLISTVSNRHSVENLEVGKLWFFDNFGSANKREMSQAEG